MVDKDDKDRLKALSELEELTNGVLAIPTPEDEHEEDYELTRRLIKESRM